jgi:tetratricopeptide (TPR) repeat protein
MVVFQTAAIGCTPALREPPDVQVLSGNPLIEDGPERVDGLLGEGEALYARRPETGVVKEAEARFLEAAALDSTRVEGLIGAVRALAWRVEHEPSADVRASLATRAVQVAQWCALRAPEDPRCDYWLAIALGIQSRERPSTATSGVEAMVAALRRAATEDPKLDRGGPWRVLALVLIRAPGWPAGPGDPEEGLTLAERAVRIDPSYPPNLAAWAEGLRKTGDVEGARNAWRDAAEIAEALAASGHPDAREWAEAYRTLSER